MVAQQPIDDSIHTQQLPKRRWWRRKRVWISALVLILLAIVGIVVGAIYGVKHSRSEDAKSDRDRLYAAQGGTSALPYTQATQESFAIYPSGTSNPHTVMSTPTSMNPTSTDPSSMDPSSTDPTSTDPTSTYPTASTILSSIFTSESSSPSLPLLRGPGFVPKDLSAAIGGPSSVYWDLRAEGQLFKKEGEGSWEAYPDSQFLVAPIAVKTGDDTLTAISVEAVHGNMLYSHFRDGVWGDWQELEFAARFSRRPAVISRAQGRVDVFNSDNDAYLWVVSYDGSSWSEWTKLGDATNGDVAATTWGEDRIDVFVKFGDTTNAPVQHKYWTAELGWAGEWEDLGMPFTRGWDSSPQQTGPERFSSPLATSWCDAAGECKIDVVLNAGTTSHKLFQQGAWNDWYSGTLGASHEGAEFPDTASIVRGDGLEGRPFAHLVSRGTDTCIHHIAHNGTEWYSWTYLWCEDRGGSDYPNEFLPTFLASADGANIEVFARDLEGNLHKLGFYGEPAEWPPYPQGNERWENLGQP